MFKLVMGNEWFPELQEIAVMY